MARTATPPPNPTKPIFKKDKKRPPRVAVREIRSILLRVNRTRRLISCARARILFPRVADWFTDLWRVYLTWAQSEPPRGRGWVQAQRSSCYLSRWLRTHPLPRGGSDRVLVAIQYFSDFSREANPCEWLLNEFDVCIEHTVLNDRLIGVARHVENTDRGS